MDQLKAGGTPAPREHAAVRDVVSGAVLILICLALYLFFTMVRSVQQEQAAGAIRGYKNRAVLCDMVKGLGLTESKECADPAVRPYRDPTASAASSTGARNSQITLNAVCAVAVKLGVAIAECSAR